MKLVPIAGKANVHLFRHPKTGVIYLSLSKKGRGRIVRSTKTTILTDARRIADEIKFKFLGQRNPKHGRKLNKELIPEWLETKLIKSKSTYYNYNLSYQNFRPFIDDLGPEDITSQWWEAEYIPRMRLKKADRKFFNDRKMLRMYLIALREHGVIETVPKLVNPDPEIKKGKVYSDAEIVRLLDCAQSDLKLQILMAVTMGMRKSEILLLALDRVDQEKRLIELRAEDTKIRKARSFAISASVWPLLSSRLDHPSGYLFPSNTGQARPVGKAGNQTAWEATKKRAQVVGRFHDLRHTFLTRAFKCSTNPALICHYAGLSLEEAQRTYLHFTAEDTRSVSTLVEVK